MKIHFVAFTKSYAVRTKQFVAGSKAFQSLDAVRNPDFKDWEIEYIPEHQALHVTPPDAIETLIIPVSYITEMKAEPAAAQAARPAKVKPVVK